MRKMFLPLILLALSGASFVRAQNPPPAPAPVSEILRAWNEIGHKLIEMAEDFPEDKYDYKPTPEVRSFAEILLHVAGGNYFFLAIAQGKKPGEEDLPREQYKTRAEVAAALKKSFATGASFIQQAGEPGLKNTAQYPWSRQPVSLLGVWTDLIGHCSEHYGNLVVYYRLNGLVPPASRPRR